MWDFPREAAGPRLEADVEVWGWVAWYALVLLLHRTVVIVFGKEAGP